MGGQTCRAGPARAGPALQRTSKRYPDPCDLITRSAVDRRPARRKRHRFRNRAKIDEPPFTTRKNENVTTSRTSIGALSSAEFLPQRVSLLYRLSGNDVPAILLTSAIAGFALWGNISDKLLVAWLIWLVVASLVRIVLKRAYHLRRPGPEAAARWEGFFCLTSASVGTAWGLTVMLLYPEHGQFHEILLAFLIGSVAMGLPPALAPSPKSFACLIVPIFANDRSEEHTSELQSH